MKKIEILEDTPTAVEIPLSYFGWDCVKRGSMGIGKTWTRNANDPMSFVGFLLQRDVNDISFFYDNNFILKTFRKTRSCTFWTMHVHLSCIVRFIAFLMDWYMQVHVLWSFLGGTDRGLRTVKTKTEESMKLIVIMISENINCTKHIIIVRNGYHTVSQEL